MRVVDLDLDDSDFDIELNTKSLDLDLDDSAFDSIEESKSSISDDLDLDLDLDDSAFDSVERFDTLADLDLDVGEFDSDSDLEASEFDSDSEPSLSVDLDGSDFDFESESVKESKKVEEKSNEVDLDLSDIDLDSSEIDLDASSIDLDDSAFDLDSSDFDNLDTAKNVLTNEVKSGKITKLKSYLSNFINRVGTFVNDKVVSFSKFDSVEKSFDISVIFSGFLIIGIISLSAFLGYKANTGGIKAEPFLLEEGYEYSITDIEINKKEIGVKFNNVVTGEDKTFYHKYSDKSDFYYHLFKHYLKVGDIVVYNDNTLERRSGDSNE